MKPVLLKIGSLVGYYAVDRTYLVTSLCPNAGLDATVQMEYCSGLSVSADVRAAPGQSPSACWFVASGLTVGIQVAFVADVPQATYYSGWRPCADLGRVGLERA